MSGSVTISIDGEATTVPAGVSLGSVLHTHQPAMRRSPVGKAPRGLYCGMGVCFECLVDVDGRPERACLTPVSADMRVLVHR